MGEVIDKDFQDVSYDRANHILYGIFRYGSPWLSHFGSFNLETGEFTEIQNYDISNYACFAISKDPTYILTFTVDNGTDPIEGAEIEINGETIIGNLECPCHGSNYDVRTGVAHSGPAQMQSQIKVQSCKTSTTSTNSSKLSVHWMRTHSR